MNKVNEIFVAGYGSFPESGDFYVILKDKVMKNSILKAKASKTGTWAIAKGATLEEIQSELPRGKSMSGTLAWGDMLDSDFGGIYKVVELGEEVAEVVEEKEEDE